MAIVSIDYPIEGLSADIGNERQSQTETAIVVFDSAPSTAIEAAQLSGFYSGMPHRILSWLAIEDGSLTAEPAQSGLEWEITATYSSMGAINNQSDREDSFRAKVVPFNWSYSKVVTHDKETGEAILNPAGDPYDPPFTTPVPNIGWRITLRETNANMSRCFLIGQINKSAFTLLGLSIPKYCAQLSNYLPDPQYDEETGTLYFLNTYEIKLNFALSQDRNTRIGFKQEVLNSGLNILLTANDFGTWAPIYSVKSLENTSVEHLLKADGTLLPNGSDPTYSEWVINDLTGFSSFGLPTQYPSFQNG